jgi:predicted MFS family arabinose efflux permease
MLAPYRALWAIPGAPRLIVAGVVARIPAGLVGLALLFLVESETGSYGTAGTVVGGFGLATAVAVPAMGRLVDRRGQPAVLIPLALSHAGALAVLVALALSGAGAWVLVVCAIAAGATLPPLGSSIRALWPGLAGEQTPVAFALEAVLLDTYFVLGPLLAAGISAAFSPAVAVLTGAAMTAVGTLAYATAPATRAWHGAAPDRRPRGGALSAPAIRALVVMSLLNGGMFGFLELALPAFADERGAAEAGGVLIAMLSIGSIVGGVVYGALPHPRPLVRRTLELSALLTAGCALLLLPSSIAAMAAACVVAGLALAPLTTVYYLLIEAGAPRGLRVEANAWVIAASSAGVSLGAALGGALAEGPGVSAVLVAMVASAALATLWVVAWRRVLEDALDPAAAG